MSLDNDINWIGCSGVAAKSVFKVLGRLTLLESWMHHDLTWGHVVGLAVLADMGRSAKVTTTFISVHI